MPTASVNAVNTQALDDQANQRLGRLEGALLALKPQIEAMVAIQSKLTTQVPNHANSNPQAAPRGAQTPGAELKSFEGLRSSSAIASRLRHVLDAAHRILNEETLPVLDTVRVVRKIMRVSKAMRLENPEVITEDATSTQLVYEAETDQIRERLIGCGMMLIQHNKEPLR
eukprot:g23444.t1